MPYILSLIHIYVNQLTKALGAGGGGNTGGSGDDKPGGGGQEAVSYTHLDVYKRQIDKNYKATKRLLPIYR